MTRKTIVFMALLVLLIGIGSVGAINYFGILSGYPSGFKECIASLKGQLINPETLTVHDIKEVEYIDVTKKIHSISLSFSAKRLKAGNQCLEQQLSEYRESSRILSLLDKAAPPFNPSAEEVEKCVMSPSLINEYEYILRGYRAIAMAQGIIVNDSLKLDDMLKEINAQRKRVYQDKNPAEIVKELKSQFWEFRIRSDSAGGLKITKIAHCVVTNKGSISLIPPGQF